ncbi:winged helix-turn-helix domain-containing protein [Achromobacter ruhlandii]|uniref:response regulator n=1 Tax=Achromobacter ruhlandii TaxID=72557 RepID=UPI0021F0BDE7|nr:response regulator [Achromobacter ruhlandii]MCV6799299.1 winged helix-turn-helix domain-containing protein [Achromobacter ruhlandii]MCV6804473.1 winged helix-turn-helix domain-containing protein [Achromobacter ruhlandii]MCV6809971.1 winged helix-turn-helix domain-containing protein [Achromobacter ruhlandii]MCV6821815.1 winged helix-turn-helix domain-containing protein [Achromobacter ruhlandii]
MRILLVEDDASIAVAIQAGLGLQGFVVDAVGSLRQADLTVQTSHVSACVLDLCLPDGDGMTLLAKWRARRLGVPVLVLSARSTVPQRVDALRAGADDYLPKPFDLDELGARLQAVIRRAAGHASDRIDHGRLTLFPSRGEVLLDGARVTLQRRELALLQTLLQHPGQVLTMDQLHDSLYGFDDRVESNAVNVHIHKLRRKFGADLIETVRGLGYRLGVAAP